MSIGIDDIILKHYPKALDCKEGHRGGFTEHIEQEIDDDRTRDIKLTRCDHCGMPVGGTEYV
jgi:hypothetical protein